MALVPRFVPAHAIQLDHRRRGLLRVLEIALHDLDPADEDEAVLARVQGLQGGRVHDAEAGAGQGQAHGAGAGTGLDLPVIRIQGVRDIDAGHRRGLGGSITLVEGLLEFEHEGLAHVRGQALGPRHHQPHGVQHEGVDLAVFDVEAQEGGGAEQHGGAIAGDGLGAAEGVGGVRVADHGDALHQGQEGGDGEAEGVEGRQIGHEDIIGPGVEQVRDLANIGHDVAMSQLHALGGTLAPAGEEDGGGVPRLGAASEEGEEGAGREQGGQDEHPQGGCLADLGPHRLHGVQADLAQAGVEVDATGGESGQEAVRRDDVPDAGAGDGGAQGIGVASVVEVHHLLAGHEPRQVGDGAGAAGGEQDAEGGLRGQAADASGEEQDGGDQAPIRQVGATGFDQGHLARGPLGGPQPADGQGGQAPDIILPGGDGQLEDRLLDLLGTGRQGQGCPKGDHHRPQPPLLAAPAQGGGGVGKPGTPQAAQIKGHQDRVGPRRDLARRELEAALELGDLAVLADGPLGEDAHHLARLQQPGQGGDGMTAAAAGDGHHLEEVQETLQVPALIDLPLHDEAHRTRAGHLHQGPVQPTDVVAEQHDPALGRQVIQAENLEPEAGGHQVPNEETDQGLGELVKGVEGPDQGHQGQPEDEGDVADLDIGGGDGDAQEG